MNKLKESASIDEKVLARSLISDLNNIDEDENEIRANDILFEVEKNQLPEKNFMTLFNWTRKLQRTKKISNRVVCSRILKGFLQGYGEEKKRQLAKKQSKLEERKEKKNEFFVLLKEFGDKKKQEKVKVEVKEKFSKNDVVCYIRIKDHLSRIKFTFQSFKKLQALSEDSYEKFLYTPINYSLIKVQKFDIEEEPLLKPKDYQVKFPKISFKKCKNLDTTIPNLPKQISKPSKIIEIPNFSLKDTISTNKNLIINKENLPECEMHESTFGMLDLNPDTFVTLDEFAEIVKSYESNRNKSKKVVSYESEEIDLVLPDDINFTEKEQNALAVEEDKNENEFSEKLNEKYNFTYKEFKPPENLQKEEHDRISGVLIDLTYKNSKMKEVLEKLKKDLQSIEKLREEIQREKKYRTGKSIEKSQSFVPRVEEIQKAIAGYYDEFFKNYPTKNEEKLKENLKNISVLYMEAIGYPINSVREIKENLENEINGEEGRFEEVLDKAREEYEETKRELDITKRTINNCESKLADLLFNQTKRNNLNHTNKSLIKKEEKKEKSSVNNSTVKSIGKKNIFGGDSQIGQLPKEMEMGTISFLKTSKQEDVDYEKKVNKMKERIEDKKKSLKTYEAKEEKLGETRSEKYRKYLNEFEREEEMACKTKKRIVQISAVIWVLIFVLIVYKQIKKNSFN